jgi:hypothetical protein
MHEERVTSLRTFANSQHDGTRAIEKLLANSKLSTRSNESLPLHLICISLFKQEHLNCTASATFQF